MEKLLQLANDDYQKRGAKAPKSQIPTSIEVHKEKDEMRLEFDFKNTNEANSMKWYKNSLEFKTINQYAKDYDISLSTLQDGDYKDDWLKLIVSLKKKITSKQVQLDENNNSKYIYCYTLSTQKQKEKIDLTKHKSKLEPIIKGFFGERLISVIFEKESYTLHLRDKYEVADKRRLGRLISEGSDLKQYVHKVLYNANQDSSGQLFRLKKLKE